VDARGNVPSGLFLWAAIVSVGIWDGDGINPGFLQSSKDYPRTDAANLANFYVGINLSFWAQVREALTHWASQLTTTCAAKSIRLNRLMPIWNWASRIRRSPITKSCDTNENKYLTRNYLNKLLVCFTKNRKRFKTQLHITNYIEEDYYESFEFCWRTKT